MLLVVLWTVNYLLGFITVTAVAPAIQRDAGAAVVLPLVMCLAWWGANYCSLIAGTQMAEIAGYRKQKLNKHIASTLTHLINKSVGRKIPYIATLAVIIGSSYVLSQGLVEIEGVTEEHNQKRIFLLLHALPVWFFVVRFIATLTDITLLVKKYLHKHLSIQLFEVEEIAPVCKIVLANFLMATMLLATYPINIVFVELPPIDQFITLFFSVVLLGFLVVPIFITRNTLKYHQSRALERINEALRERVGDESFDELQRRLVDSDDKLQYVSDLLMVRKEVMSAPLWPLTAPFTIKMLLLMLLPFLTWVGAGIISQVVKLWL